MEVPEISIIFVPETKNEKGVMKKSFKNLEKGDKVYRVVPRTESIGDEISGEVIVVDLYVEELTIEGSNVIDLVDTRMFNISEGAGGRKHMTVFAGNLDKTYMLSEGYYWFTDQQDAYIKRHEMFKTLLDETEREYEKVLKKYNTIVRNFYNLK